MVRRCWICETDLYTAKGQAREAVLAEGDMLEVDTSSAAVSHLNQIPWRGGPVSRSTLAKHWCTFLIYSTTARRRALPIRAFPNSPSTCRRLHLPSADRPAHPSPRPPSTPLPPPAAHPTLTPAPHPSYLAYPTPSSSHPHSPPPIPSYTTGQLAPSHF